MVNRNVLRGTFLQILDGESDELHQFSQKLFDKNGFLKPELIEHDYHRGTGCWGEEVNDGLLVYIDTIEVNKNFHRSGVGSWAMQQLLSSPHLGTNYHAFAWPTSIEGGITRAQFNYNRDRAVAFFRKNNFRRVGRTPFFAYSPDSNHSSRAIPISEDAEGNAIFSRENEEPDVVPVPEDIGPLPEEQEERMRAHMQRYMLHHLIAASSATMAGPLGMPMLPQLAQLPQIEQTIAQVNITNPDAIHRQDEQGMTPLHLAAGMHNLRALRALLGPSLGPNNARSELERRDNTDGVTPLEACEREMRNDKEFRETMLGAWNGYPDEGLRCAYELRRAMGEEVGDETTYVRSKKWGCTCGQCVDGWLSPRMGYRISWQATVWHDMIREDPPRFKRGGGFDYAVGLDTLPPRLANKFTRPLFNSYLSLFPAIDRVIESKRVPTSDAVLADAGSAARSFIQKGGKVKYALDLVTLAAEEQSPVGDNEWDSLMDDLIQEGSELGMKFHNMVKCTNDLEFGFVRQQLGLPKETSWFKEDSDEDDFL
ncbi:unnamed protein product [Somion occarium]